jgi:hypothetical protein
MKRMFRGCLPLALGLLVSSCQATPSSTSASPGDTWIVFTRRTDHGEIYVMRADGSEQEMLPGLSGNLVNDCCARWGP